MSFEFHGRYQINDRDDIKNVTNARDNFSYFQDISSRVALLAQAMNLNEKSYAQVGNKQDMGLKLLTHTQDDYNNFIREAKKEMETFHLIEPDVRLNELPFYSFFLHFTFTLAKPYISRDDESFYIIDNPVKKDKVFKVPFVAASSWKGNLREAMRLVKGWDDRQSKMIRLFGNPKEEEENLKQGRLRFYPTFFNEIDLEIINPHDRQTKTGINPIYMEVVPSNAKGNFSLLYIPFDLIVQPENTVRDEILKDLNIVVEGVRAMMLDYGFSAKKSSGYGGIDDDSVNGTLDIVGIDLLDGNGEKDNTYKSLGSIEDNAYTQTLWGLVKRLTQKGQNNE